MTIIMSLTTMLLMGGLSPLWEAFATNVCNASTVVVKYSQVTTSILTEEARRKSFGNDLASDIYLVQGSVVD